MNFINKIYLLLGKKNFLKFNLIIFFQICISIIEMVGIGIFFPLFTIISNPEKIDSLIYLKFFFDFFEINKENYFLIILLFLIAIFIFKFFIQIIFSIISLNIYRNFRTFLSKKILSSFYYFDYNNASFKDNNKFFNLIVNESERFNAKTLGCLANIISESFLLLIVIGMLIFFSSIQFLYVSFFYIFLIIIIIILIKSYLKKISIKRLLHQETLIKNTKDSIYGFKDIKIYNVENIFINNFFKNLLKLTHINKNFSLLDEFPRYFIELVSSLLFGCLIFYFFYSQNFNIIEMVPVLALYGVAALRIMPSLNRILSNLQGFKSNNNVLDELIQTTNFNNAKFENKKINFENKIRFQNINFVYEKSNEIVLHNLNLEIKKGDFVGIFGKSGSGKSTFLNILLGFLKPTQGKIYIDDEPLSNEVIKSWHSKISYVGQNMFLLDASLLNNIAINFEKNNFDNNKIQYALKISQLENFYLNKKNKNLGEGGDMVSGGEKQRIAIARAAYKDSEILILDEPTSSLDFQNEKNFFIEINKIKKNKTIFLVTHNEELLLNCDKILKFESGKEIKVILQS